MRQKPGEPPRFPGSRRRLRLSELHGGHASVIYTRRSIHVLVLKMSLFRSCFFSCHDPFMRGCSPVRIILGRRSATSSRWVMGVLHSPHTTRKATIVCSGCRGTTYEDGIYARFILQRNKFEMISVGTDEKANIRPFHNRPVLSP